MKSQKIGQAIAEYLILVAIIAVGSVAVVSLLQENLDRKLAQVSNAIGGVKNKGPEGKPAEHRHYKRRDMGDFSEDAVVEGRP